MPTTVGKTPEEQLNTKARVDELERDGLLAERDSTGGRPITERGMEAEELPHPLAVRAGLGGRLQLPAAGGVVADEELQPLARTKTHARVVGAAAVVRPDVGAAFGVDVLQAVHRLAQLPVHRLIRSLSLPPLPSLRRSPWINPQPNTILCFCRFLSVNGMGIAWISCIMFSHLTFQHSKAPPTECSTRFLTSFDQSR